MPLYDLDSRSSAWLIAASPPPIPLRLRWYERGYVDMRSTILQFLGAQRAYGITEVVPDVSFMRLMMGKVYQTLPRRRVL